MPVVVYSTNPYLALNDKRDTGGGGGSLPAWSAGASEYMVTGSGSHEMQAQLIGEGTPTFDTPAGLLLPDYQGVYVEIPENTPPWHGARWDNGVAYSDYANGDPLQQGVDDPTLVNTCEYSGDWGSPALWQSINNCTADYNQVGITGAPNTASLITSNSSGGGNGRRWAGINYPAGTHTMRLIVKATAGNEYWIRLVANSTQFGQMGYFNLATGNVDFIDGVQAIAAMNSMGGGWYECILQFDTTATTGSSLATVLNGSSNTLTGVPAGSTYIGGSAEVYFNTTLAQVEGKSAMVTEGATGGTPTKIGQFPSLYAAPEMTNLVTYSRDLTQSPWNTAASSSVTYDQAGITGEPNTATLVTADVTGNARGVISSLTLASTGSQTARIICKVGTTDWVRFSLYNFDENYPVYFNIATGTVGTVAAGVVATDIESLGNGWYACYIEFSTTDISGNMAAYLANADGDSASTAGDTMTVGSYEVYSGKTIAQVKGSAPIVTEGVAVTNSAISIQYDALNVGLSNGAIYGEYLPLTHYSNSSANRLAFLSCTTSTTSNFIYNFADNATGSASNLGTNDSTDLLQTPNFSSAVAEVPFGLAYGETSLRTLYASDVSIEGAFDGAYPQNSPISLLVKRDLTPPPYPCTIRNVQYWDLDYAGSVAKLDELIS